MISLHIQRQHSGLIPLNYYAGSYGPTGSRIHSEKTTGYLYDDAGQVTNPATGVVIRNYKFPGLSGAETLLVARADLHISQIPGVCPSRVQSLPGIVYLVWTATCHFDQGTYRVKDDLAGQKASKQ